MVDTVRTLSALQTLLADNTSGDISAQDVRDMLVSVFPPQFSGARLEKSSTQSYPTGSPGTITWQTEAFDTDSYGDVANNRLVIPFDGYFVVFGGVACTGGATNTLLNLAVGGTNYAGATQEGSLFSPQIVISTGPVLLSQNDAITMTGQAGAARTIQNEPRSFLSVVHMGQAPA